MKNNLLVRGFTLVELLIVISLISILSVAVLATINPIEQANKAKDSTTQNDAAEVLNSYERYYANNNEYPWMNYVFYDGGNPTVDDAILLRSDSVGFGVCSVGTTASDAEDTSSECDPQAATGEAGILIDGDELKNSFVNKNEFKDIVDHPENALYTMKVAGSGGSIYVCYVPKAKSNRQQSEKLYCIDNGEGTPQTAPTLVRVGEAFGAEGTCTALTPAAALWATPTFDGLTGMFRCVPE